MLSLDLLAETLRIQNRPLEAEQMNRRVLQFKQETLGEEHFATLSSMASLAAVISDQGKLEEAESMYRRVLDLDQNKMVKDD